MSDHVKTMKRVQLVFTDGTVYTAEGLEAEKYHEQVCGWGVLAFAHGAPANGVNWTIITPQSSGEPKE